jgi:hypothetical protein
LNVAVASLLVILALSVGAGIYVSPNPQAGVSSSSTSIGQCQIALCSTTKTQKTTYNPSVVNGLRQDLGKFSMLTSLTAISWNVSDSDYLQFNPPTVGPTTLSNVAIYYNSTVTAWQMSMGLNTVAVYFKPGTYSANVFIQANLASAYQLCLPFKAPSIISHPVNSSYIKNGNEVFSWSDIATSYSPTWNVNKLCLSLPIGLTIIDPLAIDGSGGNVNQLNAISTSITTTSANDVIEVWTSAEDAGSSSSPTTAITSSPSLTWHQRAHATFQHASLFGNSFDEWYAVWSSSGSISVTSTWNMVTPDDNEIVAYGVSGANTASPFDSNAAIPGKSATSSSTTSQSVTISTNNANDMIISGLRYNGQGCGCDPTTPPGGFTKINSQEQGGSWTLYTDYKIVSSTQSGVAISYSWTTGASENGEIVDAIQQGGATVTQPIQIALGEVGPSYPAMGISGCGVSNSTFTTANVHTYTLTASCTVTLTGPSTTYTRYDYNVSPKPTADSSLTFSTCSSGTCGKYFNTTYYQLFNNFTEIAKTPAVWDGYYANLNNGATYPPGTNDLVGTYVGTVLTSSSNPDLCFASSGGGEIETNQGQSYGNCLYFPSSDAGFVWSDYGTGCWPSEIGNTWALQTVCPVPTTGDNTYLGYYVQSAGGSTVSTYSSSSFTWLLALPVALMAFIVGKKLG